MKLLNFLSYLFIFYLSTIAVFGQSQDKYLLSYGGLYFSPSKGYIHSLELERRTTWLDSRILISALGEIGGPYGLTVFAVPDPNSGAAPSRTPYNTLHLMLGVNMEKTLSSNLNKGWLMVTGLHGGYARYKYDNIISARPIGSTGASIQGFFSEEEGLIGSLNFKIGYYYTLNKISIQLLPTFRYSFSTISTFNAGLTLRAEF